MHLTRPSRLTLADRQLVVAQEATEVRLALEDVAWLVIDTPQATLTTALIAACMEAGIAIICTDIRHTPSGVLLPFHRHHRQAAVASLQIAAGLPLKKRLWQRIVQAKIVNQAAALRASGADAAPLTAMADRVGSGDPDNIEAQAAREYWRRLFAGFVRDDDGDCRNGLLDYGYAVVRAAAARALVASGLLPCLGLHHASASNPFNLADDLVEPFRPFVDRAVHALVAAERDRPGKASVEDRRKLASVLLDEALMGDDRVTLLVASELAAASLVRALEAASAAALLLPRLPG